MTLSIIITAHNEGLLLHKTLLSLKKALTNIDNNDYEIILHIDNGSSDTVEYAQSNIELLKGVKVFQNAFGDLGESRNFSAQKASGEYLFFIDGDDLISENFIDVALATAKEHQDTFIHPNACLSFEEEGAGRNIWIMTPSSDIQRENAYILFEKNMWISCVFGKKALFEKYPYRKTHHGFGHEDYRFNIETVTDHIPHLVAPDTVHFYRKKTFSLLTKSSSLTQRYTDLFDFNSWKRIEAEEVKVEPVKQKKTTKQVAKEIYLKARGNKILNTFITPAATVAKKVTGVKLIKPPRIPDYIYDNWLKISQIETQLYPSKSSIKNIEWYDARLNNNASEAYSELANKFKGQPDYVFIVPWIVAGGADKVLINYIKAIKETHPDWKVAVITTLPSDNPWQSLLPDNAYVLDFGNYVNALYDDNQKDILFSRIITQLNCPKLHIINSEYGYRWAKEHIQLIKSHYELNLCLFCHDVIPNTKGLGIFDYADPYASAIFSCVKTIYTDNEAVIDKLERDYGFSRDKIKVHYQPAQLEIVEPKDITDDRINILWAGRVCTQKNPEVLRKIAKKLNPEKFHIDAYGKIDGDYGNSFFSNIDAITYKGGYNGFNSINRSNYDVALYTSLIDGLPNIILEEAASGLPIVASNAGGIKNFIKNKETGILIDDPNDVDGYVKALEYIYDHRNEAKKFAKNAQLLLEEQHSWKNFIKNVKKDF